MSMIEPCFCGRCLAERSRYEAGRRALRQRRGGLSPCDKVLDRIVAESVERTQAAIAVALAERFAPAADTSDGKEIPGGNQ